MHSATIQLWNAVTIGRALPFEYVIEHGGGGTFESAWRSDALAHYPQPDIMLTILQRLGRHADIAAACAVWMDEWDASEDPRAYDIGVALSHLDQILNDPEPGPLTEDEIDVAEQCLQVSLSEYLSRMSDRERDQFNRIGSRVIASRARAPTCAEVQARVDAIRHRP